MRILAPAIVDPATHRGGAGTVIRALARLLSESPLDGQLTLLPARRSRRLHRLRQAGSLLRSVGSPLPAKAHFLRTRGLREEVARRLREERFDRLLILGSDLLWLLEEIPARPPTVLVAFNTEHALYRSQIEGLGLPPPLRGLSRALLRDCAKLQRLEEASLAHLDAALCVSRDDADQMRLLRPELPVLHVPPFFDTPRADVSPPADGKEGLDLGFLGNFEWWPNRAGLDWLLREVLPHLPADVRLHLFGHRSESGARSSPRVHRHGFVPAIADVWRRCDFMICPIDRGAGVSVKLAEALYHRIPMLARPFATRGLGLAPDPAVVTLDSAAEWIAFLRSPRAHALARQRISLETAGWFDAARHGPEIQTFLRDS